MQKGLDFNTVHCEARSDEAISLNKTPSFNKRKDSAELLEIASSSFLVVAMTGIECHPMFAK